MEPDIVVVRVAAWIPGCGYIRFARYVSPVTGAPLPIAQAQFHCVLGHEVCPADLSEQHRLVSCLNAVLYTGVGAIMLMPKDRCPICRVASGLASWWHPSGTATSESEPPDVHGCA